MIPVIAKSYSLNAIKPQYINNKHLIIYTDSTHYDQYGTYFAYKMYELDLLTTVPGEHMHEVIFGEYPHKMFFDIDIKCSEHPNVTLNDSILLVRQLIGECIKLWRTEISSVACYDATLNDFIVYNSNGADKYSYHIMCFTKHKFANNSTCRRFAKAIIGNILGADKFIDDGVYSRLHNLRLLGVSKGARMKILDPLLNTPQVIDSHVWTDSLVGDVRGAYETTIRFRDTDDVEPIEDSDYVRNVQYDNIDADIYNVSQAVNTTSTINTLSPTDKRLVMDAIQHAHTKHLMTGMKFSQLMKNEHDDRYLISFNRTQATFCALCGRQHEKDNTLYILVMPVNEYVNGRWCYARCRHNRTATMGLGYIYTHNTNGAATDTVEVDGERIKHHLPDLETIEAHKSKFMFLQDADVYSDGSMHEYPLCATLCIDAPMKLGKTKALLAYMTTNFPMSSKAKIRILTFRQTFAFDMYRKCAEHGFILYTDVTGVLTQSRIIVQMESLHRLAVEPIDLLVLDECESIFEQFNSEYYKNFGTAFAIFHHMLKRAKHVVCMDAFIGDRSYNVLERIRGANTIPSTVESTAITTAPPSGVCNIIGLKYVRNMFSRDTDCTMVFTKKFGEWIYEILCAVKRGRKIAIMTNSKEHANCIEQLFKDNIADIMSLINPATTTSPGVIGDNLETDFPILDDRPTTDRPLVIGKYTSETPSIDIKAKHFQNIDHYWSEYDILITTPTVSAGVSFEKSHYDRVYGLFTDRSCGAEMAMQMLGRIRCVREKKYMICINETYGVNPGFPITQEKIKHCVLQRYNILLADINLDALSYTYNTNGTINVYNSDYFTIWVENQRIIHINRNGYLHNFLKLAKKSGFILQYSRAMMSNDNVFKSIECRVDEIRAFLSDIYFTSIAESRDITKPEYEELQSKIEAERNFSIDKSAGREFDRVTTLDLRAIDKYRLANFYLVPNELRSVISAADVKTYIQNKIKVAYTMLNHLTDVRLNKMTMGEWIQTNKDIQRASYFGNISMSSMLSSQATSASITDRLTIVQNASIDIHTNIYYLLRHCGWEHIFDFNKSISVAELCMAFYDKGREISVIYADLSAIISGRQIYHTRLESREYSEGVNLAIRQLRKLLQDMYQITLKKASSGVRESRSYKLSELSTFSFNGERFVTSMHTNPTPQTMVDNDRDVSENTETQPVAPPVDTLAPVAYAIEVRSYELA